MSLSRACCERATDACCPRSLMSSHRRRDDIVPSSPHLWSKHPGFVEFDEEKRVLSLSLLTHLPTYQPTYQPTYLSYPILSYPRRTLFTAAERYRALFVALSAQCARPVLFRRSSNRAYQAAVSLAASPSLPRSVPRGLTRYKHVYGHSLAP